MAQIGQEIDFTVVFTNDSDVAADPTSVRFLLRENIDGTELEWSYAAVPVSGTNYPVGMNPIVKDSTGNYSLAFVARKAERLTGFWQGSGTVNQSSQTTVFVRHSDINLVEP